ncbi:serine/threonine-protein kinase pakF-like [Palaemon carinicauda]|uniref:serine/threonine-protein kinase pakF-like n=1 Tax=Palaemon carinicauda TaxID=392227 RepID=UPI0035B65697
MNMLQPLMEIRHPGDQFLKEFQIQLAAYTNAYEEEYSNITQRLEGLLLTEGDDGHIRGTRDIRRSRRQVAAPDMDTLLSSYSHFFGTKSRRRNYQKTTKKRKNMKSSNSPPDDDMPIVLVPQEDETECVASSQLSSFGFLGFVLNVVNAVINVANNINNNDNSNNDNNNNNNNNDQNVNTAAITQTSSNTNDVMAMAGRRLDRLRQMRDEVRRNMRTIETHNEQRRQKRYSRSSPGTGGSCQEGNKVVDEALLTSVALIDMWKEVLFEGDPYCMALEFCETSWKLSRVSRLAGMMTDVASVAAAHMLKNFQGVNPDYLIEAADQGRMGANCSHLYQDCNLIHGR